MVGSVGLALISWLEKCSNQVKTFDLILGDVFGFEHRALCMLPLSFTPTTTCWLSQSRIPQPKLIQDYDLAWGIRKTLCVLWEAKSGRALTPAADSPMFEQVCSSPVCYVI
jgi:hypothetical protein